MGGNLGKTTKNCGKLGKTTNCGKLGEKSRIWAKTGLKSAQTGPNQFGEGEKNSLKHKNQFGAAGTGLNWAQNHFKRSKNSLKGLKTVITAPSRFKPSPNQFKWAKISLNEPKTSTKSPKPFKRAPNQFKWAQNQREMGPGSVPPSLFD